MSFPELFLINCNCCKKRIEIFKSKLRSLVYQYMSLIFAGETPTGRFSPEQSLLRAGGNLPPGPNVTALHNSLNMSQNTPRHHHKKTTRGGSSSDQSQQHKNNDFTSHSLVSFDSGVIDDRLLDTSLPGLSSSRGHHHHHHHRNSHHQSASHSFTSGVTGSSREQGMGAGSAASSNKDALSREAAAKLLMDQLIRGGGSNSQLPAAYYSQHGSAAGATGGAPGGSHSFSNTILYDDRVRGSKDSSRSKRSDCQDSGYNELPGGAGAGGARPPNPHDPATNK